MDTHVKVLGVLEIAMSSFALLAALVLILVFGGAMGYIGANADLDANAFALPLIGIAGTALVGFLVLLSVPGFVVGVGLLKRRPWARIGGIVLSIVGMMAVPFGTALGIYGLWVLLSSETERLFTPGAVGSSR